ncbi:DMT family transporter [Candidatus Neomarinimicrobiota bacterium]
MEKINFYHLLTSPWFIGSLACFGITVIIFAKALDYLPVSTVYPVLVGLGFISLALAGSIFLNEHLIFIQIVGLGTILLGIILVVRGFLFEINQGEQ